MARGRWLVLLGGTLAVVLAACGGGSKETPPPSPAASVRTVLEGSARAMAQVTSFRFALDQTGGDTPIPGGLGLRSARGAMARPDRLTADIKASVAGFIVEVKVVSVGDRAFMTNPITGAWQTYERGVSPVAFLDPAKGVGLILQSLIDPSIEGEAASGGAPAFRVRGRLPAEAVQFVAGSFAEGSVVDAALLIARDDLRLRQATLAGRITKNETEGIVRVLTFSEFDRPVTIEPPV